MEKDNGLRFSILLFVNSVRADTLGFSLRILVRLSSQTDVIDENLRISPLLISV